MADPTSYEIVKTNSEKYVNYKIAIAANNETWFVVRRYREFRYVYDQLQKIYPKANLKIPPKKIFGNFSDSTIDQRVRGLNELVAKIISIPGALELEICREFFQIPPKDRVAPEEPAVSPDSEAGEESVAVGALAHTRMSPSDFIFLTCIGKGSFGRVFLGKQKTTGDVFAIKVLTKSRIKSEKTKTHLMSERNVLLNNLKHPFLVSLKFAFQTPSKLYFVLDYINGGELFYYLQKEKYFPEPRAKFYTAEIACALGFMHLQRIVYRDLKPENLLLDREGHVVLTDFGLAKKLDSALGESTNTFCGTPEYLAPEILRKESYSYPVDWWTLGCVLYEMLFGIPPFYMKDREVMLMAIKTRELSFNRRNIRISSEAEDFMTKILDKDPKTRLGSDDDLRDLDQHPFFLMFDMKKVEEKKLKVPFTPTVKGNEDTSLIDEGFKAFPVGSSQFSAGVSVNDQNKIIGFTYARPMGEYME